MKLSAFALAIVASLYLAAPTSASADQPVTTTLPQWVVDNPPLPPVDPRTPTQKEAGAPIPATEAMASLQRR
jgi:hypothetical protein